MDRSPLRINRRDEVSSQATDAEEIEANRFAAELLMPYDMIMADLMESDLDIEDEVALRDLAERYGVSLQAMTLRIRSVFEGRAVLTTSTYFESEARHLRTSGGSATAGTGGRTACTW